MSRHLSYDDMLEQLDRFIENLDAKTTTGVTSNGKVPDKPLPEADYDRESQEEAMNVKDVLFTRIPV